MLELRQGKATKHQLPLGVLYVVRAPIVSLVAGYSSSWKSPGFSLLLLPDGTAVLTMNSPRSPQSQVPP